MSTLALGPTLLFLLCVALATAAQNLTGFAFALILVGLAGVFNLASLPDAVNVAGALSLASALVALRGSRTSVDWPALRDTALGSVVGVAIGVLLLGWLSNNVITVLRVLLGLTVIACAIVVYLRAEPLPMRSPRRVFAGYGVASGVLGGLFSAAGPPLVYHFFRQPLPLAAVRQTLVATLALGSALRLAMVIPAGGFSARALQLVVLAAPLVLLLSWLIRRYPPGWPPAVIQKLVSALLLLTGVGLIAPVLAAWVARG